MLLRDALTQGIISKGDVIIYTWRKDDKNPESLFEKNREVELFGAFMVESVEEETVHDRLGIFPYEQVLAIFKPPLGRNKAIQLWPQIQDRMNADTMDTLIHRLLDAFHDGILFRDGKCYQVSRGESVVRFRTKEIDMGVVLVAEEARNREDNQRATDAGAEFARRLAARR